MLLAEGAPAESYLDTGNRALFEGGAALLLHPDFSPVRAAPCYTKLLIEGAAVAAVRARLIARAKALGYVATQDADLHLRADGQRIDAEPGASFRFAIPPGGGELGLLSRTGVPAEMDAGSTDGRRLGVALGGLLARGPQGVRDLLWEPELQTGFHEVERRESGAWRWTDGNAVLPASLLRDATELELSVAAVQASWISPIRLERLAA